jgi:hypothetical protein
MTLVQISDVDEKGEGVMGEFPIGAEGLPATGDLVTLFPTYAGNDKVLEKFSVLSRHFMYDKRTGELRSVFVLCKRISEF